MKRCGMRELLGGREPTRKSKTPGKEATLFDPIICADPEQAQVYIRKGNALGKLDRDEEALAAYEKAIHLVPQDADASQSAITDEGHLLLSDKLLGMIE
jgi:hypothetical protein